MRFSNVIERAGRPAAHLILSEPSKDRALQAAIHAERVMTVQQQAVGTKTDRGEIGFHPGTSRQFFVFPKSLRAFVGRTVVGIKYELLDLTDLPKRKRVASPPSAKKASRSAPARPPNAKKPAKPGRSKVVQFNSASAEDDHDEPIVELKQEVRQAMAALEAGKAVAAFNLLKRIVER